jgi:hypothetical protein
MDIQNISKWISKIYPKYPKYPKSIQMDIQMDSKMDIIYPIG